MTTDLALESTEYCQMLPATEESPRQRQKERDDVHHRGYYELENSNDEEQYLHMNQGNSNIQYEVPTASRTLEKGRHHEYKSLTKSRVGRSDYTLAKTVSREENRAEQSNIASRSGEEEGKSKSRSRTMTCIMCCVVVYITVTFVITATLMAYTIWSVQEVEGLERRLYEDFCNMFKCVETNNFVCNVSAL